LTHRDGEARSVEGLGFTNPQTGRTSERHDSQVPHGRAILDPERDGRVLVLITHNTDYGDAFEREGENRAYFDQFAGAGYAFGINALLYALSH